jgi:hypothetical protein
MKCQHTKRSKGKLIPCPGTVVCHISTPRGCGCCGTDDEIGISYACCICRKLPPSLVGLPYSIYDLERLVNDDLDYRV